MFILLAFITATGVYLDESYWSHDHVFATHAECSERQRVVQRTIDESIIKDKGKSGNPGDITFVCLPDSRMKV